MLQLQINQSHNESTLDRLSFLWCFLLWTFIFVVIVVVVIVFLFILFLFFLFIIVVSFLLFDWFLIYHFSRLVPKVNVDLWNVKTVYGNLDCWVSIGMLRLRLIGNLFDGKFAFQGHAHVDGSSHLPRLRICKIVNLLPILWLNFVVGQVLVVIIVVDVFNRSWIRHVLWCNFQKADSLLRKLKITRCINIKSARLGISVLLDEEILVQWEWHIEESFTIITCKGGQSYLQKLRMHHVQDTAFLVIHLYKFSNHDLLLDNAKMSKDRVEHILIKTKGISELIRASWRLNMLDIKQFLDNLVILHNHGRIKLQSNGIIVNLNLTSNKVRHGK